MKTKGLEGQEGKEGGLWRCQRSPALRVGGKAEIGPAELKSEWGELGRGSGVFGEIGVWGKQWEAQDNEQVQRKL